MEAKQQDFKGLVDQAKSGKLRLPEFQRDWKWNRSKVIRLFDSIRKDYPIGSFLTLEANADLYLSPRLFSGVDSGVESLEAYVLDGQQRITAGLALFYGLGAFHYFLNLNSLWAAAEEQGLDFDDQAKLKDFADNQDEDGLYLKAKRQNATPEAQIPVGLFWTPYLADDFKFSQAKDRYLDAFPDRKLFMERLVGPYFKIGAKPIVPVTQLDAAMPVESITRVFETLNSTGQRLTPVEIVVALLFAQSIRLRGDLEEFHEITDYYCNMERTGELFLQVVALLDGKVPQKAALPRNIDHKNYARYRDDAINNLEKAGRFLSERFGIALSATNRFVPYPAMLAPLGIALDLLDRRFSSPSPTKANWQRQLERWFVGSVLEQRYSESQPTTQRNDMEALTNWIQLGDDYAPKWLEEVRVRRLDRVAPNSAIGRLITCLMSRNNPHDPLNDTLVGGSGPALASAQQHHIFPKQFCSDFIGGWDQRVHDSDLALNTMPVTKETNQRWSKMDPLNQVADVRARPGVDAERIYQTFTVDASCLEIMGRPDKQVNDFLSFVEVRGKLFQEAIANSWGFVIDAEQVEDEDQETADV